MEMNEQAHKTMRIDKRGIAITLSIILASIIFVAYIRSTTPPTNPIFPNQTVYQFPSNTTLTGYTTENNVTYSFEETQVQAGDICLLTENKIVFFRDGIEYVTRDLLE